jgi:hypothetical protein
MITLDVSNLVWSVTEVAIIFMKAAFSSNPMVSKPLSSIIVPPLVFNETDQLMPGSADSFFNTTDAENIAVSPISA